MADSILNFGALFKPTAAYNRHPSVHDEPLYSNPLRRVVKVTLALTTIIDLVVVVCGAFIAATYPYDWTIEDVSESIYRIRLFFFFCSIPFVLSIAALIEVAKYRRRSLTPKYTVMSTSMAIVLLLAFFALTAGCNYGTSVSNLARATSHCPYVLQSLDSVSWSQARVSLTYAMPWLGIAALCCYISYLVCASIALHQKRKTARYLRTALLGDQELDHLPISQSHQRGQSQERLATPFFDRSRMASPEPSARLPRYYEGDDHSPVTLRPAPYARPPSYTSHVDAEEARPSTMHPNQ